MKGCTITDEWNFRGIKTVIFENQDLRIVILSGKGTDIFEIVYKPLNLNLLFRNPWGPLSPILFPLVSPHDEVFRDYTGGGWSDILPNAGRACEFRGARFGLHDETPLLSWSHELTVSQGPNVSARFWTNLRKYPFFVEKMVSLNEQNEIAIRESVTNTSSEALPFSWLIHPTFSRDFFGRDSKLEVSAKKIRRMSEEDQNDEKWQDISAGTGKDKSPLDLSNLPFDATELDETLVLTDLKEGRYCLTNSSLDLTFSLQWDLRIFPYLWYYRSINAKNYPYYGRSQFIALEPCTSARSGLALQQKKGDARVLGARERITTEIVAKVTTGKQKVRSARLKLR